MIRVVVHYTGRVQGVGFRWTTANLARGFAVAGYVMNLPDGRVRLEAQGARDQVDGLLVSLGQAMGSNIGGRDIAEHPPDPALGDPAQVKSFEIRR
ncbi:MAG: acylphosphatase [Planctomycetota bacterium]